MKKLSRQQIERRALALCALLGENLADLRAEVSAACVGCGKRSRTTVAKFQALRAVRNVSDNAAEILATSGGYILDTNDSARENLASVLAMALTDNI